MSAPTPLSPPTGFVAILRQLGPGLIISANIVGSGELIVTPGLGAEAGIGLLWFIVLGCLLKVFVQIEFGRYAVARGRTTLEALNEVPGPRLIVSWLVWLWVFMFIGTFFQVAGMCGNIAQILAEAGEYTEKSWLVVDKRWLAVATGLVTAVLLVVGRFRLLESFSTVMVVGFTACTLVAVGALQSTPYALTGADLAEGMSFHLPPSFTLAFAAFGVIGVGAAELIYYPYWCLEKGYARNVGPADGSAGWAQRARGWLRVLRIDAWVSCAIYTTTTLAFFALGATVLHDKGLKLDNLTAIPTLSHMYRETFGDWSLPVFLCGAFFVLYSTIFVSTASNTRLIADALVLFRAINAPNEEQHRRLLKWLSALLPVTWVAIYLLAERPTTLILIGAVAQGLMLPFLGVAAVWLNHRRTDAVVRPGMAWRIGLWISAVCLGIVGAYQVWLQIRQYAGP